MGATFIRAEDMLDDSVNARLSGDNERQLETAIRSALITFFRTETPAERKHSVARVRSRLDYEGRSAYQVLKRLLDTYPDVEEVYVPNGRFPNQKMTTLAAQDSSVKTLHFEKGETPNGAYLQPYAPQSRVLSQASVDSVLAGLNEDEIDSIADEWLAHRVPSNDSRNEFAALWENDLPPLFVSSQRAGSRIAGFFTSSQDEFQSLGPEWQLHSWKSQFEAFDAIMTRFEGAGFQCYIRVHPNLATKAHDSFTRERNGIRWLAQRHPGLLVIWHDDFANTYALMGHTDAIVVWDSTVGLEASARGIPVWTTAASRYGLTADIREVLSFEALDAGEIETWTVNEHSAKRFIAYMVKRDSQMEVDVQPWESWDAGRPPRGARLSRILVSGGNPTVRTAVQSLIDVYRHRRVRSNVRSVLHR